MANVKITDLGAYTDPVSTDVLPIVDVGADVTKKVSIADLLENAGSGTAAAPGIAFDGDSDTGIYRPGADQLALATNGAQRLLIEADGDVNIDSGGVFYDATNNRLAIGTTSPSEALEVTGNAILDASNATLKIKQGVTGTTGAIDFTLNTDSTSYGSLNLDYDQRITQGLKLNTVYPLTFECGAAEEIVFNRATTESARIDSSGRLLIGTSSQSGGSLLQVNDDRIRIASSKTPASASDTGTAGEICWDSSYIYVCTATDTWKRAALSTW